MDTITNEDLEDYVAKGLPVVVRKAYGKVASHEKLEGLKLF